MGRGIDLKCPPTKGSRVLGLVLGNFRGWDLAGEAGHLRHSFEVTPDPQSLPHSLLPVFHEENSFLLHTLLLP
jgi:hypothetical protein